jgi:hypothetical protein
MNPLMNDTKWDKVRLAMYGLDRLSPQWRTKDAENGLVSDWDGEWFYHFRVGGYKCIEWLEIKISSPAQYDAVLYALEKVRVPGEQTQIGFMIYGYAPTGVALDYLTRPNTSPARQ